MNMTGEAVTDALVAVAAMVAFFGFPLVLVGIILWFKQRRLRMTHETILSLAEKGLPVPPELLNPPPTRTRLGAGLVTIGVGLGLAAFFWQVNAPWSIGLIPGFIGMALVLSWVIEGRNARKKGPPPS